jgi:Flp pilus assembly secretin CpaC
MRPLLLAFAVIACTPNWASAADVAVSIDQAARITLAHPARDIIVGNPGIADVTLLDARHLIVTGKSYGVTNLLVTDQAGRTILNRQLVVAGPTYGQVSLHRGVDVADYACSPRCERSATPAPGSASPAPQPAP